MMNSRRIRKGSAAFFYFKEYGTHVEKSDHERSNSEGAGHFSMTLLQDGLRGSLV